MDQDNYGTNYYTDSENLYIYDNKQPIVKAKSPKSGEKKVSLTESITLSISKPVLKNSDFSGIRLTANGVQVSVKCTLSQNNIIIKPSAKLKPKTKYTVTIPKKAVRDLAKNTLSKNYTYTFTTR